MPGTVTTAGPTAVRFALDAVPLARRVRLDLDLDLATDLDLRRVDGCWRLDLPRPAVDRLEYRFEIETADGTGSLVDPGNPDRIPGPFGDRSEIRFPEYRAPAWLDTPAGPEPRTVPGTAPVPTRLWSPQGLPDTTPAPLLLVHDGTDMAIRGSLLRWAAHRSAVAPLRVALLDPADGARADWYAANPAYAALLAGTVVPAIAGTVAVQGIVGLGASLGAVGMMTLHRTAPGLLAGLALQSGSFFTPELDPQESGFTWFGRLCATSTAIADSPGRPVPTLVTVGTVEENRANNERLTAVLRDQGWPVRADLVRDGHTMIGWRDAWFPALDELLEGAHG
ncbi:esterase [Nakamurella sp. YIM 132087]|uniref:Esterase n=1 Tax=Nakamurella alba TaxID=2665158 RepID=A0A7K1FT54_9ACTN|nr:esterase [Nakamurella alba]MTD17337.1 esterase [Nakamurella alba]